MLPLEDVNPGTVNLNLNAVIRNPKNVDLFDSKRDNAKKALLLSKKNKLEIEGKNNDSMNSYFYENKSKFGSNKNLYSMNTKRKMSRNLRKSQKKRKLIQVNPISIEEKVEEHCFDMEADNNRDNQMKTLSTRFSNFNRKKFTEHSLNEQQIYQLESNFTFNYNPRKIRKKRYFRTTRSLKTKRIGSKQRKKHKTQILTQRIDEKDHSQEYSDSSDNAKEPDMYSIEPQESLSKMAFEKSQPHFYKPITSTMSIKSSNPILKNLDKKIKLKKLKPNVSFREPFGLEEETRDLNSNKSVKFSGKISTRSKHDLFNISDNKSRLSNFSADLFPSNSNFTYDVNKIKQLRAKKDIYKETIKDIEGRQDGTRSQSKLGNLKKNSLIIPKHFQKYDHKNPSENEYKSKEPQVILNDNRKFKNVIYNTNQISHQQLNIINMTLSVQNTDVKKVQVSGNHNDSYTYSKHSMDR